MFERSVDSAVDIFFYRVIILRNPFSKWFARALMMSLRMDFIWSASLFNKILIFHHQSILCSCLLCRCSKNRVFSSLIISKLKCYCTHHTSLVLITIANDSHFTHFVYIESHKMTLILVALSFFNVARFYSQINFLRHIFTSATKSNRIRWFFLFFSFTLFVTLFTRKCKDKRKSKIDEKWHFFQTTIDDDIHEPKKSKEI